MRHTITVKTLFSPGEDQIFMPNTDFKSSFTVTLLVKVNYLADNTGSLICKEKIGLCYDLQL